MKSDASSFSDKGEPNGAAPVLILGAGPSGLGVALGLHLSGFKGQVRTIEKNPRVGGLSGSFLWKENIIDFGPHRLSPNLEYIKVLVEEILGPNYLVQKSQHGVQYRGRLYQFPPRVADWVNLRSIWELACFGLSFFFSKLVWITRRFRSDDYCSIMARNFGNRFYRRILAPMTSKVWVSPEKMDPSFVNQRFAQIRPLSVVKKMLVPKQELNPSDFFYPRLGFQQIWDEIRDYVQAPESSFHLSSVPKRILVEGSLIKEIELDIDGVTERVDTTKTEIVSTIPVTVFLNLIEGPMAERLKEVAKGVKFRSMILVAVEFDQEETLPFRTLIFPEKDICFNRLFEQNKYSRETVQAGKSIVVADITLDQGDPLYECSDEELKALVLKDLQKLSYIPHGKISDMAVKRVPFAYVVPDVPGRRAMYELRHHLKAIKNLRLIGRFAAGEYDNSDYALENGLNLAALIAGKMSRYEYLRIARRQAGRAIVG